MSVRLIVIEARRNVGLWLVPVILLVSWWLLSAWGWIAILWSSTNEELQAVAVPFTVPAMAGAAAWMAGRERRRGTADLLASTPRPPLVRGVTLWMATAFWGILAYAIFAAFMMGRTALVATWGGPDLWRVMIAVAAILAASACGFFFGSLAPSRFTAPVVAVAALGIQQYFSGYMTPSGYGYSQTWVTFLAADKTAYGLAPWQTLTYLALTAAALSATALMSRRTITGWSTLAVSVALVLAGVVMIWGAWPRYDAVTGTGSNAWGQPVEPDITSMAVEPVCQGAPVSVCVHPRYAPLLEEAAVAVNRLAEPLLGLPGVPLRAEESDVPFVGGGSGSLLEVGDRAWLDVSYFADTLVAEPASTEGGAIVNEAQLALRSWLLQRAGIESHWRCDEPGSQHSGIPGQSTQRACGAADRFAALPAAKQQDWLRENYLALRSGTLALEDLP